MQMQRLGSLSILSVNINVSTDGFDVNADVNVDVGAKCERIFRQRRRIPNFVR